jgi:hypothetical protein
MNMSGLNHQTLDELRNILRRASEPETVFGRYDPESIARRHVVNALNVMRDIELSGHSNNGMSPVFTCLGKYLDVKYAEWDKLRDDKKVRHRKS